MVGAAIANMGTGGSKGGMKLGPTSFTSLFEPSEIQVKDCQHQDYLSLVETIAKQNKQRSLKTSATPFKT